MVRLKRLRVPEFWNIQKKKTKWAVVPRPGPHKKMESIPLQVLLRDILKIVETGKEAKLIVRKGEVLVDQRKKKDFAFGVGLMDSISIPKIGKHFRVVPYEKGLKVVEISADEAKKKICRIESKKTLKKGKTQINLHDGKNLNVDKYYKTGDSVLLQLPDLKILDHLNLEKGSLVLLTKGKNSGKTANVKEIIVTMGREPNKLVCSLEGKDIEVIKNYVLVVGKDKPLIYLGE